VSLLNIGQQISAICAAKLLPDSNRDVLVIGTQTNLLVYDVYQNSELFYKDVSLNRYQSSIVWHTINIILIKENLQEYTYNMYSTRKCTEMYQLITSYVLVVDVHVICML